MMGMLGMEQISVLKILTAMWIWLDDVWLHLVFRIICRSPPFFHFPHVKVWYGWDLFWSVSSVRGRSAWPTAKYVFSHYSLPSRWPWSSTTCRILCEGLGRQRPCGPEKCWRDGLLPVMTKKATRVPLVEETSCSIETGGSSTPFNPKQPDGQWSLSHQNRWPLRLFAPPLRPRELEASTRHIELSPFWVEPAQEKKNKSNS